MSVLKLKKAKEKRIKEIEKSLLKLWKKRGLKIQKERKNENKLP